MGIFWVADYDSEVGIEKSKICCQNCKIRNGVSKMVAILVQILSFFAIARKLAIWGFSGSLITNMVSVLQNSKWKIENGGDVSLNRMCFGNCYETWYTGIFGIADCNSDIRFVISDL